MKKNLIILFVIAFSSSVFAYEYKLGALEIKHPYVRATNALIKVSGGFMTIENKGSEFDKLVHVTSDSFAGKVEIHETSHH
jgi:copper(I)-binding protein